MYTKTCTSLHKMADKGRRACACAYVCVCAWVPVCVCVCACACVRVCVNSQTVWLAIRLYRRHKETWPATSYLQSYAVTLIKPMLSDVIQMLLLIQYHGDLESIHYGILISSVTNLVKMWTHISYPSPSCSSSSPHHLIRPLTVPLLYIFTFFSEPSQ
jgi:hypothetical protein